MTKNPLLNPFTRRELVRQSSALALAAATSPLVALASDQGNLTDLTATQAVTAMRSGDLKDDGLMPLSHRRFDQVGPLARSVADVILFDSVVTGEHAEVSALPLQGRRIGTSDYLMQGIDAECGRIVVAAIDRLKAAGAEIVPTELPPSLRMASDVEVALLRYELFSGLKGFLAEEGTGVSLEQLVSEASPNLRGLLEESARPFSEVDFRAQDQKQQQMKADAVAFFRTNRLDALVFAPSLTAAFPQGDPATLQINGRPVPLFTSIGRQVAIGSCASLCGLVLPAGMTAGGLPVGMEFDALPGTDRQLLGLGLSLEKALGPVPPPRGAV